MEHTLIDQLTKSPDGMRLYQQERAILEITELLCELMEEDKISRAELARRLGKTKGYITQLLDGRTNMTLRTISDAFGALGRAIHFQDGPLSVTVETTPLLFIQDNWPAETRQWSPQVTINYPIISGSTRVAG